VESKNVFGTTSKSHMKLVPIFTKYCFSVHSVGKRALSPFLPPLSYAHTHTRALARMLVIK